MCKLCGDPNCHALDDMPDEFVEMIAEGIVSSGFPPLGLLSGLVGANVDTTAILMDPKSGTIKRFRDGFADKDVSLDTLEGLPDVVKAALHESMNLDRIIKDKTGQADFLDEEADRLSTELNRRRTKLRFQISDLLPGEHHELYGDRRLTIQGDEPGSITVTTGRDDLGIEIEKSAGTELLTEQNELDRLATQISGMRDEAKRLHREAERLPELHAVKRDEAHDLVERHLLPILEQDGQLTRLTIGLTKDDELRVIYTYRVQEETDDLTPAERNMLGAMFDLDVERGAKPSLYQRVRKMLGLGPKAPEISDQSSEGSADSAVAAEPEKATTN